MSAQAVQAETLVAELASTRVLPVVTVAEPEKAESVARALGAGGLSCIEITFRTPRAAEAIRRISENTEMFVGAGTVLSPEQAEAAAEAGARFAVAPGLNGEVVSACKALELPFFPGIATPTEIECARSLGLDVLKVFPASTVGGVAFLRAVTATYPEMRFIPTGGIGPDTFKEYLAVPSVLAIGGSWLAPADLLRQERYDEIEQLAREATTDR